MIAAGTLKHRIVFQSPDNKRGDLGGQSSTYVDAYSCRASVVFSKGARAIMAGEYWNPTSVVITCRESKKINNRQRIKWGDNTYIIVSINPDKADRSLTIIADLLNE